MRCKKINKLILFLFITFNLTAQIKPDLNVRKKENFNKNWKFQLADDIKFSAEDFDDSSWRVLNLPHDWSVEHNFSKENSGRNAFLPGGIGWYRKNFSIPKSYTNKHFEIQFDGVYRHSEVWVNGDFVGVQYDGYASFYYDITPFLGIVCVQNI